MTIEQVPKPPLGRVVDVNSPDFVRAAIARLHEAYCQATGMQVKLLPATERGWWDAHKAGLTAYDLVLVLKDRERKVKAGKRWPECLLLRNIVGNEDRIADVLNEAAMIKARMRIRTVDPSKASVMRATGRELKPPAQLHQSVKDVLRGMV